MVSSVRKLLGMIFITICWRWMNRHYRVSMTVITATVMETLRKAFTCKIPYRGFPWRWSYHRHGNPFHDGLFVKTVMETMFLWRCFPPSLKVAIFLTGFSCFYWFLPVIQIRLNLDSPESRHIHTHIHTHIASKLRTRPISYKTYVAIYIYTIYTNTKSKDVQNLNKVLSLSIHLLYEPRRPLSLYFLDRV